MTGRKKHREVVLGGELRNCFQRLPPLRREACSGYEVGVVLQYGPGEFQITVREYYDSPEDEKEAYKAAELRLVSHVAQMWAFAELWKIRPERNPA